MFTVRTRAAAETVQNLQQLAGKLNQQIEEVEGIVSRLRRISEYDEVRHILRVHLESMRAEKYRLQEMMAALDEIQKMYNLAERNVTDYGEQIHHMNQKRTMKVISPGNIGEIIEMYHIR